MPAICARPSRNLRPAPRTLLVAASFLIAACGSKGRAFPAGSGVHQPPDASWSDRTAWSIGPEPLLDLTESGTGPEYQFFQVADLCWSGKWIAVAETGSGGIKLYRPDGTFLRMLGGKGRGPGEFTWLIRVFCEGSDRIEAFDGELDRVSTFSVRDGFLRSTRFAASNGRPPADVFPLAGGGYIGTITLPERSARVFGKIRRYEAVHLLFSDSGAVRGTLAVVPGDEIAYTGPGLYMIPVFAYRAVQTVSGNLLYAATSDSFEISVFDRAGRLRRRITRPGLDLSLSAGEARAKIEEVYRRRTGSGGTPATATRNHYPFPLPRTRPPMSALLVDPGGNVWAAEFAELDEVPRSWSVFSADGDFLGIVQMPARFQLLVVGSDRVGGVLRDGLDVEHVVILPLLKVRR